MNIKVVTLTFAIFTLFIGCKMKSQCDTYSKVINKSIETDYNIFFKENAKKIKTGEIKPDPLNFYTSFNTCSRKNILFSFPKDSIFVMENNREDDYAGTVVNTTSFYKKDKVFFFRSTNKDIDSLNVDRNYILNNKYNDGESYKYISQLKQGKLSKTAQNSSCVPLKDMTFLSLIVDKKLKKIYKICSGKVIELK